jgi:hypothetical protein
MPKLTLKYDVLSLSLKSRDQISYKFHVFAQKLQAPQTPPPDIRPLENVLCLIFGEDNYEDQYSVFSLLLSLRLPLIQPLLEVPRFSYILPVGQKELPQSHSTEHVK